MMGGDESYLDWLPSGTPLLLRGWGRLHYTSGRLIPFIF